MAEPSEGGRASGDAEVDVGNRRVHAGEGARNRRPPLRDQPEEPHPRGGRRRDIAQAGLSGNEDAVVVILFVIVASVSIAVPVLVYLFGGEKAQHVLDGWKAWLGEHNAAVMTVLLVVMGSVLLGKGLDVFD